MIYHHRHRLPVLSAIFNTCLCMFVLAKQIVASGSLLASHPHANARLYLCESYLLLLQEYFWICSPELKRCHLTFLVRCPMTDNGTEEPNSHNSFYWLGSLHRPTQDLKLWIKIRSNTGEPYCGGCDYCGRQFPGCGGCATDAEQSVDASSTARQECICWRAELPALRISLTQDTSAHIGTLSNNKTQPPAVAHRDGQTFRFREGITKYLCDLVLFI